MSGRVETGVLSEDLEPCLSRPGHTGAGIRYAHASERLRASAKQARLEPTVASSSTDALERQAWLTLREVIGKVSAMFDDVRSWIQRQLSSRWSRTPSYDQQLNTATRSREDRAEIVVNLQREVRNIQQQISDLSDAMGQSAGQARTAEMTALTQQLAQKQQELSRYQARV